MRMKQFIRLGDENSEYFFDNTPVFTTRYKKNNKLKYYRYRIHPFQNRTIQYNNIFHIIYEILKFDYLISR